MASVEDLKQLNRSDLNEFALSHGIENAADTEVYKTKEALATELSPKVTPEQLGEFIASKTAGGVSPEEEVLEGAAQDASYDPAVGQLEPEEPADPATQPFETEDEAELQVGDRVSYPFKGVHGDRLVGTVRGLGDGTADVVGYDGATHVYPVAVLKKED